MTDDRIHEMKHLAQRERTFNATGAHTLMNTLLKAGLWFLMSLAVASLPGAMFGQAPARAEEYSSPPPHLHGNLWMQTSAEYQALCRQTFNSALREIRQTAKKAKRRHGRPVGPDKKPLAVVADLDETILDNARFQSEMDAAVWANGMDIGFTPKRWEQWERDNPVEVGLVPGAGPFIAEVEQLKIVMVYVSNRLEDLKASTIRALAHNGVNTQGLELDTEVRLLLKEPEKPGGSSKLGRIKQVDEKYHVVAYLGDNLGDFPASPEPSQDRTRQLAARRQYVESSADLWGTRYFMLPNPVYGSWDQILPKTVQERMGLLKRAKNQEFVKTKPQNSGLAGRPSLP